MRLGILATAILTAACSRDASPPAPQTPDPPPAPADARASAPRAIDAAPTPPPAPVPTTRPELPTSTGPVYFPGRFPGAEEEVSVDLTWSRTRRVRLRAQPERGAKVIGRVDARKGKSVPDGGFTLLVTSTRTVTAKRPIDFGTVTVFDATAGVHLDAAVPLAIDAGQAVEYLHYGSEGTAYVRIDGVVYLITSPQWRSDFAGLPKRMASPQPKAQQWWVRVEGEGVVGWVEVTPKVIRARVTGP